ncbi:olfactomedin-like protein 2B [Archocentrus centrarchus]|uniref:olfactomedin-like protein 2B n=1 Tax=Archocentrus centrarchus TaxID=63155 RepID=UPI0011EA5317|nr:olfactomedin-like protein 2B [Archocentrus centrarchus]
MWRRLPLLILCCAVSGLEHLEADRSFREKMLLVKTDELRPIKDAPSAGKVEDSPPAPEKGAPVVNAEGRAHQPTAEPLEDELDNQENIISQLLGDYDKVKTVSSGSDCVCRCIVRPIKRSDCSRVQESDLKSPSQDFYTVETITKGTDCKKCECMAPPSAVNPCEGEYRFKKLQEASKDDIKLATIIDLLEGSLYGMDLLKLHSVTTKLLTKVDNIEKTFAQNLTERMREKERGKERAKEKDKEKKIQQKKKKMNDLERSRVKSGAAAYAHKQQKDYDSHLKKNQQQDGVEEQHRSRNQTETQKASKEKTEQKQPMKDKTTVLIRGVTFYKAVEESYQEDKKVRGQNTPVTTTSSVDLLISEQLPFNRPSKTIIEPDHKYIPLTGSSLTHQPTAPSSTSQETTTATQPARSSTTTTKPTTTTSQKSSTTRTAIKPTAPSTQQTTLPSDTNISPPIDASPTSTPQPKPKSRLSWTESPADQLKTTKKPGVCKDTVASISEPVQKNTYGLSDGAWMRDARGHGSVIYLTNGHYGNNLLEFRDMETFKSGQTSNSYKLPYSFTGTGHVVYNGAFYYNRAFSRDIIRYDLRHRYVAAWTTLHDALLEEQIHRTQTEVELAVDESGLWLLYPALDTEGFHQEVILLIHLHPRELQPIQTFRTGLRRGRYGNSFLVCGVLYAVDSMEHRYANVTYAFDTHTLTHTVPSLAFTNMHAHNSQLAYCPLDKKLYSWDNGHQMIYDVIFAYLE